MMRTLTAVLTLSLCLGFAPKTFAEETGVRPWAVGVSEANQRKALQLFSEGNAMLKNSIFVEAVKKYREALTFWDHPAIHYNLVLALLNLDQPVEVHEHLLSAMKYGASPLDSDKFEQAGRYKMLVEKELAKVDIRCDEPGAKVVLDGKSLFTAPGRYQGFVRAGPHSIVATKEGFLPDEVSKSLPPAQLSSMDLKLFTEDDLTQYHRKFAAWIPWVVVGAGVAIAGAGGGMHYGAVSNFHGYDDAIKQCGAVGCVPSADVASKRTSGNTLQTLAITSYAVGGAALVTGAVLAYVNRLQPYRVSPDAEVKVSVAPYIASGTAGIFAAATF